MISLISMIYLISLTSLISLISLNSLASMISDFYALSDFCDLTDFFDFYDLSVVVCKKYYIDTLVEELGVNNSNNNNPTYVPTGGSYETTLKSHNQFILVGLEMSEEDQNLPYLY